MNRPRALAPAVTVAAVALALSGCGGDEPPIAAIDAFTAAPSDATLAAAKQAWLEARYDYGVTEAFRFYGGPIDDEEDGPRA